jgi:ribosomal protein S18 acetylase RimI-like enzyme
MNPVITEVAFDHARRQVGDGAHVLRSTGITIQALDPQHARQTAAVLDDLRVSLFGVQSARLYATLTADALKQRIDCRIATAADQVCGTVIAAPHSYWLSTLVRHTGLALASVRARLLARPSPGETDLRVRADEPQRLGGNREAGSAADAAVHGRFDTGPPLRTWTDPGDAWRIIFVGTEPEARGLGVAAALYRALMRDHSLIARIAPDNEPSIRLHRSVGWRLYPDGDVVSAVHLKPAIG